MRERERMRKREGGRKKHLSSYSDDRVTLIRLTHPQKVTKTLDKLEGIGKEGRFQS